MSVGGQGESERNRATDGFPSLLYRYFFFDWLFQDASRGSWLERESALRFNRQIRDYLPVYLRRWIAVVVCSFALGASLEKAISLNYAAGAFYCLSSVALVVAAMIVRLWLGLKYE